MLGMVGEEEDREMAWLAAGRIWRSGKRPHRAAAALSILDSLPSFLLSFSGVAAVAAALFTMFNSAVSATSHFRDGERERERGEGAPIRFLPFLQLLRPILFQRIMLCDIFSENASPLTGGSRNSAWNNSALSELTSHDLTHVCHLLPS